MEVNIVSYDPKSWGTSCSIDEIHKELVGLGFKRDPWHILQRVYQRGNETVTVQKVKKPFEHYAVGVLAEKPVAEALKKKMGGMCAQEVLNTIC